MSKRVEDLLDRMTIEEQVDLLAGSNIWNTWPIERLDIPKLRVSDGPAGVRGSRFDGPASINIPCGTAVAATWDPALVRGIGELLAREMESKGARVHLAPTVNLHRTPVGGRNFECFSEDPYLTAVTAVEYVRGVQSTGYASCIKHFVGNDTEFERMTIDSQIDERTMREAYLVPFERAVRDAQVMSVMSSYNRVNGPYAADSHWLLTQVLRDEWGFDGAVISDWFGLHSTTEGVNAGCDLEMPGPTIHRGGKLLAAIERGEVSAETVRARARNILNLIERTDGLDNPPTREYSRDDADDIAFVRRAGAASMVLLKNANGALPLAVDGSAGSVAVIGPNAAVGQIMGGGSAHVSPVHVSHPLDSLVARFGAANVHHAPGCNINKKLPEIDGRIRSTIVTEFWASTQDMLSGAAPVETGTTGTTRLMWLTDPLRRGGSSFVFAARLTFDFTPDVDGEWRFGIESVGATTISLEGTVVVDTAGAGKGGSFFGNGTPEVIGTIDLVAGRTYRAVVEVHHGAEGGGIGGMNLGAMGPIVGDQLAEAVDLAARCDVSVVVVGTNDDWESEGWDRADIDLPGRQDILVNEVAKVSKRTIVVVNAGSPVAMPWLDDVDAVIMAWFPGQEFGDALVDVLTGAVEPSGRLPVTFPRRMEDTPASEHHPGRNGAARYLEGRLIGYRWYDTIGREPQFPFGFGLGYADVQVQSAVAAGTHAVDVVLHNTSERDGVQVVQVYAHRADRDGLPNDEPDQRLVGFARVQVAAGATVNARVDLDVDAYRMWDVDTNGWAQWSGAVELRVGTSSRHVAARIPLTL